MGTERTRRRRPTPDTQPAGRGAARPHRQPPQGLSAHAASPDRRPATDHSGTMGKGAGKGKARRARRTRSPSSPAA